MVWRITEKDFTWDLRIREGVQIAGHSPDAFLGMVFNANGQGICVNSQGELFRHDLGTPHVEQVLEVTPGDVPLPISGDARFLITGRSGKTPSLWDLERRELICVFPVRSINTHYRKPAAAFSRDGRYVALAATDYSVAVFSLADREIVQRLEGHSTGVVDLCFSPQDSNTLATASWDCTARIWDIDSGEEVHRLRHSGWLASVDFSPNSHRIVTAASDRTMKLWVADTGRQVASIQTGEAYPRHVRFSNDGTAIVLAGSGSLRAFRAPTDASERISQ